MMQYFGTVLHDPAVLLFKVRHPRASCHTSIRKKVSGGLVSGGFKDRAPATPPQQNSNFLS